MGGQFEVYWKEIFHFLHTCTIKFSPFSYIYGRSLIVSKGYTDIDQAWNPYYQNLCGEYQDYDTPMYVFSKSDNAQVLFSKALKASHPDLAEYYRLPNAEYKALCLKYPAQVGLIKSIVYPAKDIDTVIAAPELSLLNCDTSLLYEGESQNLVQTLTSFLHYVKTRWWVPDFSYEDCYIHAFWYMLWQSLPAVLLSQRMRNLRSPFVHPFHIWEYLTSKGLGDYRDVLTIKQSLWLYRNLSWIRANKGKTETLNELVEHILGDMSISLYGKEILQQTKDKASVCQTVPEIVSIDVATNVLGADNTSIAQFGQRLYDEKLDPNISSVYLDDQEVRYGRTRHNQLTTKYLELRKRNINTRWERILIDFLIESTLYRYSLGQLQYDIPVVDNLTGTSTHLGVGDAWTLLMYCLAKSQGIDPTNTPGTLPVYLAYNKDYPTNLATTMVYREQTYQLNQWIDVDTIVSRIPYDLSTYLDQSLFSSFLAKQFTAMLIDTKFVLNCTHDIQQKAMTFLYDQLLLKRTIELPNQGTYADWWATRTDLTELRAYYDRIPTDYSTIVESLMLALFPIDSSLTKLIGVSTYVEKLFAALKSLLVQLCSYDVTFLDTVRYPVTYQEVVQVIGHVDNVQVISDWVAWYADMAYLPKTQIVTRLGTELSFGIEMEHSGKLTETYQLPVGVAVTEEVTVQKPLLYQTGITAKISVISHTD